MLITLLDLAFVFIALGVYAPGPEGGFVRRLTRVLNLVSAKEPVTRCERILEERVRVRGVEILSHVNYSQLARVRLIRGQMSPEPLGREPLLRPADRTWTAALARRRAA